MTTSKSKSDTGVGRIYLALEKLKDVEIGPPLPPPAVSITAVEPQFNTLIEHVHDPNIKVRNLLASEIPNYLHWFPTESSMNAMLDLCEDPEPAVRMSAIRGLQHFCEKSPSNVGRISDVLGQLLGTEDATELRTVQSAFAGTIRVNFSAALVTLVELITNSETLSALRERQILFLREQLPALIKEPVFSEHIEHQRTMFIQFRLLIASTYVPPLPKDDVQFLLKTARSVKLSRSDPSCMDSLCFAVIEKFEQHLTAKSMPVADILEYFGSIWRGVGPSSVMGSTSSARFLTVFIHALVPLWNPIIPSELAASMQIILQMLTHAAERASDASCQATLPILWSLIKNLCSKPKALGTAAQITDFESLLASFVSICAKSTPSLKSVLGVFTPTGQPSDFRSDLAEKRQAFQSAMTTINSEATHQLAVFTSTAVNYNKLVASSSDKGQQAEIKENVKKLQAPTLALQNIITLTKSLLKPKPVFIKSEISMSWMGPSKQRQQQKPNIGDNSTRQKRNVGRQEGKASTVPLKTTITINGSGGQNKRRNSLNNRKRGRSNSKTVNRSISKKNRNGV